MKILPKQTIKVFQSYLAAMIFFLFAKNLSLIVCKTKSLFITCPTLLKTKYLNIFNKFEAFIKLSMEI